MLLKARLCLFVLMVVGLQIAAGDEPAATSAPTQVTSQVLAEWIDREIAEVWQSGNIEPPKVADDATFLKRVFLDLNGTVPSVSQAREFLGYDGPQKRDTLVDRLLNESRRPEKAAERTAAHWATLWRRMMVPGNSPEAQAAVALEPWLKEQFTKNVPYD